MKELNALMTLCEQRNYNFFIQYYDGEFNVSIDDNKVQIDKEIASVGGYDRMPDAITEVLKQVDRL